MAIKFIIIDSGSSASRLMFHDVKNMANAIETSNVFCINSPILRVLNRIHMSGKINRMINLPGKKIWDKYCIIEEAKKNCDDNYIVVFTDISIRKIRLAYLQELEIVSNIHLILVAVDSFIDKELCPLDIMEKVNFSLVYSFDKADCEKHDLQYTQSLYSRRTDLFPASQTSDLFFIGRAKNRLDNLLKIVFSANEHDCVCNFQILGVSRDEQKSCNGVTYLEKVKPYDEVLPIIFSSKCLLDIVQEGQTGLTMRVYEAIFYNKKLITNNRTVRDLKYYNPEFMQIVDDVRNIDFNFVNQDIAVDYNYQGEYSPVWFLVSVKRKLEEMGAIN